MSELLKLAAILVFGALITPAFLFGEIARTGWVFAVLAIVVARPLALLVSFPGPNCGMASRGALRNSSGRALAAPVESL